MWFFRWQIDKALWRISTGTLVKDHKYSLYLLQFSFQVALSLTKGDKFEISYILNIYNCLRSWFTKYFIFVHSCDILFTIIQLFFWTAYLRPSYRAAEGGFEGSDQNKNFGRATGGLVSVHPKSRSTHSSLDAIGGDVKQQRRV